MPVVADGDWVGAQDELHCLGFRHLVAIENVPLGAGAAAGLGAFEFGADKIDTGFFRERASERRPLNLSLAVDIPVVASGADEAALPGLRRPVGCGRATGGRVRVGKTNARR